MDAKIFRVNYKSDFILTLTSDAGWMTPFCIKFWTGSPMLAYYASYDGETYTHCTYDPSEPTKLTVQFDDHHLPIGNLKYQVAYHFTVADFPENTEDEVTNQANVTTVIDGDTYQVMLDLNGETAPEIQFALPAYANELQRIQNEQTRITQEQQRIAQEQTRINQEAARVEEFANITSTSNADHERAESDHETAVNDHERAEIDLDTIEEFSNSFGAYDISAAHATGGTIATYVSLTAALGPNGSNIPDSIRRPGMSVKFVQSTDNKYVQWRLTSDYFNADANNWVAENEDFRNEVMKDVNEAIASIQPIEIIGDVTNAPDEEDLTSINVGGTDVLKFKDKDYAPMAYTGLGRKYLRMNRVNGVNVLTQDMLSEANTIYHIQYDYDINGQTIEIPEGCVLEFDGGSLKNGAIQGNDTVIKADLLQVFSADVIISGTWSVSDAYPVWFGAKGDGIADDTNALKNTFLLRSKAVVLDGTYKVGETINVFSSIRGKNAKMVFANLGNNAALNIDTVNGITISGITIDCQSLNTRFAVRCTSVSNVIFDNCVFLNIGSTEQNLVYGIAFTTNTGCVDNVVKNCQFKNFVYDNRGSLTGVYTGNNPDGTFDGEGSPNSTNENFNRGLLIDNCYFEGFNLRREDSDCVKVLSSTATYSDTTVRNCYFKAFGKRAIKFQCTGGKSLNNTFEITSSCQAAVDFQRGEGESSSDNFIINWDGRDGSLDPNSTLSYSIFSVSGSNVNISNCEVLYKNDYTTKRTGKRFLYMTALTKTQLATFNNINIDNCIVRGVNYFLTDPSPFTPSGGDTVTCSVNSFKATNIKFIGINNVSPMIIDSANWDGAYLGIDIGYAPALDSVDFSKVKRSTFDIKGTHPRIFAADAFVSVGVSNTIHYNAIYTSGNTSTAWKVDIIGNKVIYMPRSDGNPSGGSDVILRSINTGPGTIVLRREPASLAAGSKLIIGYVSTENSSNVTVCNFKEITQTVHTLKGATSQRPTDLDISNDLGTTYYDEDLSKMIYLSDKLVVLSNSVNNTTYIVNPCTKDKRYKFYMSDNRSSRSMSFATANDGTGEEIPVTFSFSETSPKRQSWGVMAAPDPTTYPYIKLLNTSSAYTQYKIYDKLWVETDGATAGVSRNGTTRPAADNIYVGFMFLDTILGKPIYWNGSAWVDASGQTV